MRMHADLQAGELVVDILLGGAVEHIGVVDDVVGRRLGLRQDVELVRLRALAGRQQQRRGRARLRVTRAESSSLLRGAGGKKNTEAAASPLQSSWQPPRWALLLPASSKTDNAGHPSLQEEQYRC
jgi:hypothetical protein